MRITFVRFPHDIFTEELLRDHYRWYSVDVGHDFAKLGPLTLAWYTFDNTFHFDAVWLGRYSLRVVT